jgi:hypothetical protein
MPATSANGSESVCVVEQPQDTSRQRCILCKNVYPISKFNSSNSPACRKTSQSTDHGVVELPYGLCCDHVSRLTKVVQTKTGGRNEWLSHMDSMCMHCGKVKSWDPCTCDCKTCLSRELRVYVRYLDNEDECRAFKFWRDAQGRLKVEERCRTSDGSRKF